MLTFIYYAQNYAQNYAGIIYLPLHVMQICKLHWLCLDLEECDCTELHTIGWVLNARFFWLRIASLYKMQSKESQDKNMQWIIVHMTTPFCSSACSLDCKHVDLTHVQSTCMHVPTAIDHWEWVSLIFSAVNLQPSATVVCFSINSPPHMQSYNLSHTSIPKIAVRLRVRLSCLAIHNH